MDTKKIIKGNKFSKIKRLNEKLVIHNKEIIIHEMEINRVW